MVKHNRSYLITKPLSINRQAFQMHCTYNPLHHTKRGRGIEERKEVEQQKRDKKKKRETTRGEFTPTRTSLSFFTATHKQNSDAIYRRWEDGPKCWIRLDFTFI